jgi:hypothetical protein
MARSVRQIFKGANDGSGGGGGNDAELLKQAQDYIRAKQEASRQNLLHLQGLEIKHLESERKWIEQERARDISAFNQKEIAAINQRYDRLVHRLERRNNMLMAKIARVFGGHKRQQRRIERVNTERDAVVTERTKQHVRREAQRQRSFTERDLKVETDLQQAREKHAEAREKQRQAHEQGFEHAVKQEVNRLRHVPKPRM